MLRLLVYMILMLDGRIENRVGVGCVYDYRSHGQHTKALFGVFFGIFHGIFFQNVIKSIKNSLKSV